MTMEELKQIKESYIDARRQEVAAGCVTVDVHMGTCGIAAGAKGIHQTLLEEMEKVRAANVNLKITGCAGLCSMEPMITVTIPGTAPVKYGKLDAKKVREIFYSHILGGHPKVEYAISRGLEKPQKRVGSP
ncbi:MAG: (2Fe-2S) ferredoxin domain-containing protein [Pseudomonadota bacterium]|nr:(2Fe-2S) ferredoxin domain-containing protein [Pseudomonadota bacterium]